MTRRQILDELDALLGAPDGSVVTLTREQRTRVILLQQKLKVM